MKILRPVKRRDFSVEPAGYFNVLKPNKRFTASHPPGQFGYLPGQSKGTASSLAYENTASLPTFASATLTDQKAPGEPYLLRPALIVVAATALTLFLVWWSAGCPIRIIF